MEPDVIIELFKRYMLGQAFWLYLVCGIFALLGLIMSGFEILSWIKGETVMMRVVDVKEEESKPDEETGETHPMYRPVYKLLSGSMMGETIDSSMSSGELMHELGAEVSGRLTVLGGDANVQSDKEGRTSLIMIGMLFVASGFVYWFAQTWTEGLK